MLLTRRSVLSGLVAVAWTAGERDARADGERDLALVLARSGTGPYDYGRDPGWRVTVVNRSASRTYRVLRTLAAGFAVEERDPPDGWKRVTPGLVGRCGVRSEPTPADVLVLAPGATGTLASSWAGFALVEGATRLRVRAHYIYSPEDALDSPLLASTPPLALVSNAVELDVAHPYALVLRKSGAAFELAVTNATPAPLLLPFHPDGLLVSFDGSFVVPDRPWASFHAISPRVAPAPHGATERLAPGETRTLASVHLAPDDDERLVRLRARLVLRNATGEVERLLVSPWTDVR